MKKLISAIGFSGDDNEYTFNAQRLNPDVDASITIDNSKPRFIHIGTFIDDTDVIMNVRFNILFSPIYEIYFHQNTVPIPLRRNILIKNISNYGISQWSETPKVDIVHVTSSNTTHAFLTIPTKSQANSPYISNNVEINISLVSGNFNFDIYEIQAESMAGYHSSNNSFISEPFEDRTQVVVPVDPSIKPSKDGALWISTI